MFKSKSEGAMTAMGALAAISAASSGKGRAAERLEALAQVVVALGISPESIKEVEIDWKTIRANRFDELVPVLRMTSIDGSVQEIEQIDRTAQESK